jgi:hypothetical protein
MKRHLMCLLFLAIGLSGCGGSSTPEKRSDRGPPSFEQSPIVFGANDPAGTFFITVEDRNPKYLNDNYYFFPISLSPSRTRVLQVTDDPDGDPDRVVEVFSIEENARLLHRSTVPGEFLGWVSDEELVFSTWDSAGFFLLGVDGARRDFRFPDDVLRGVTGSLSPDGSAAAYVVAVQGEVDNANNVLVTLDTQTGRELERWSIPSGPRLFWANDGSIVLLSARDLYTIVPGEEIVRGPVPLPFSACEVGPWMVGTIHVTELVIRGDVGTCENSWVVATDGSSAVRREGAAPVAISPDGRKILVRDTEDLTITMTDPDGSNAERLELSPSAHDFVW